MRHLAEEKRQTNIAEFVLFMWQMEDLLRSMEFDVAKLESIVLKDVEHNLRKENVLWFKKLGAEMKTEGVLEKGHHRITRDIIGELALIQKEILTTTNDRDFKKNYAAAIPLLDEFRLKTSGEPLIDIELALTALYGVLTLKTGDQEISSATEAATQRFTDYIRSLTKAYHNMKAGTLHAKS